MSAATFQSILRLTVGLWIVAVLILLPKPFWARVAAILRPLASILNRNRHIRALVSWYESSCKTLDEDISKCLDNCDFIEASKDSSPK